jgi:hypothetical protein
MSTSRGSHALGNPCGGSGVKIRAKMNPTTGRFNRVWRGGSCPSAPPHPVTKALPIRNARWVSDAPSVCPSGNMLRRSNSTGSKRRQAAVAHAHHVLEARRGRAALGRVITVRAGFCRSSGKGHGHPPCTGTLKPVDRVGALFGLASLEVGPGLLLCLRNEPCGRYFLLRYQYVAQQGARGPLYRATNAVEKTCRPSITPASRKGLGGRAPWWNC